jgi:hypothetical protein
MHVFKLRAVRLRMTKKEIEESQVHLKVKSYKTSLTTTKFRDLYDWFEEEDIRLVRKSLLFLANLTSVSRSCAGRARW